MDPAFKDRFFERLMPKFLNDMQYLNEESLYKLLWSFVKAERLVVEQDAYQWSLVRQMIQKRIKEFSPSVITNILVLSTRAKAYEAAIKDQRGLDFWDSMEPELILKMASMDLTDLINLMWSSLEIKKGGKAFYDELEKIIKRKILKVKDEDF